MDGDVLSLSSSSLLSSAATGAQSDCLPKGDSSLPQNQQEEKSPEELWTKDVNAAGDRLLSAEEQVTLITESMTVTSNDQEKLLLLNKNTELRRVNKELMKLNEEWDQVYRSATLSLQQRMDSLELENTAIKELNSRLLLKVEHQQRAKEYYEQALMQELKKNQELEQCIRLLENRLHHPDKECRPDKQAVIHSPLSCITSNPTGGANPSPSHISGKNPSSASCSPGTRWQEEAQSSSAQLQSFGDSKQEMHDLIAQLQALRYQTKIYETEYETEHNDHKHTLRENRRLRKKREETRQQVALLQEQLKIYEDDFRRERSDKQMLQRLLLKKTPPNKDLVLLHRCNNEQQPLGGDRRTQSRETQKLHLPFCSKHPNRDEE